MGSQLRSQLLLGLSQSLPNSFMQGMNMAERRRAAAAAEKARRDAMGFQSRKFDAELPIQQSRAQSAFIQAQTVMENSKRAQAQWDDRENVYVKKVRLAAAAKGPDSTSAFNIGTGGDVAAEQRGGDERELTNTTRKAGAGAAARKGQELKFLKDRHAAAARGEVVESGPIPLADKLALAEANGKIRQRINEALMAGRIDLAQANTLSRALIQEGDETLSPPIKDIYGNVPRPGAAQAPAPARAPAPAANRQSLVDQRAIQYLHQYPDMSEAEAIQRAEQEVQ